MVVDMLGIRGIKDTAPRESLFILREDEKLVRIDGVVYVEKAYYRKQRGGLFLSLISPPKPTHKTRMTLRQYKHMRDLEEKDGAGE